MEQCNRFQTIFLDSTGQKVLNELVLGLPSMCGSIADTVQQVFYQVADCVGRLSLSRHELDRGGIGRIAAASSKVDRTRIDSKQQARR